MSISAPLSAEETLRQALAERDAGRLDEAERLYRSVLKENPQDADAQKGLRDLLDGGARPANGSRRRNDPVQATTLSQPAAQPAREDIRALVSLYKAGQLREAEAQARLLIETFPGAPVPFAILGMVLTGRGRLDEAVQCYRHAVTIKPDYADAHAKLGMALQKLRRLEEAVASYQQALQLKPDFAQLHVNLGLAFQKLNRPDEAVASLRRALEADPTAEHIEINAQLILPQIPQSRGQLEHWRDRHRSGIQSLKNKRFGLKDPGKTIIPPFFRLAYHDANNTERVKELCTLFRRMIPALTFSASHIESWNRNKARKRKIRVGFVSDFFRDHVIGTLYQGLIENLDRNKFELVIIHAPNARQDETSRQINELADKTITLSGELPAQQRTVAAEELDVLFYPDIGMSSATYFLAFSRLAPVQAISWGHPDTSGLDSIDYFVSASCIEPENAHSHYSERLVCLNRIPSFYYSFGRSDTALNRADFGLPETGALYGCPQNLVKFHPDFDAVLAGIAERDRHGHIILIEGKVALWSELLRTRWARDFPVLNDRITFLPRMAPAKFLALLGVVDVLLDTVHFGSGNTLYEAMACGTPIVTWPGNFMRGRIVAGAYKQMGIAEAPVAETIDDYANLAVTLAHDAARRSELRADLKATARKELFDDRKAIKDFETFLQAAVAAAWDDTFLPEGWSPDVRE